MLSYEIHTDYESHIYTPVNLSGLHYSTCQMEVVLQPTLFHTLQQVLHGSFKRVKLTVWEATFSVVKFHLIIICVSFQLSLLFHLLHYLDLAVLSSFYLLM